MIDSKNKKLLIIAIFIIIIMATCCGLMYFYFGGKTDTTQKPVTTETPKVEKKTKVETNVAPNPAYKGTAQNQPPAGMPEFTPPPSNN